MNFTESTVEDAVLSWLAELEYAVAHGPVIAPGELHTERDGFDETVLAKRLRDLAALRDGLPSGDVRVPAAYGFPADLTDEQILERLLKSNIERAAAEAKATHVKRPKTSRGKRADEML